MHANTLIELAMHKTGLMSTRTMGERVGVSHTKISEWKTGKKPIPEERIHQFAKLAGQESGPWLLLIKSEQETGELGKAWASLAKRLAATAMTVIVAVGAALPNYAEAATKAVSAHHDVYIMRNSMPALTTNPETGRMSQTFATTSSGEGSPSRIRSLTFDGNTRC